MKTTKKYLSLVLLVTLAFCWLATMASIGHVRAADVIYIHIKADGTIDPTDAPITRNGDLYTLTNNITFSSTYNVGIMIERNNMTLDGAGYTLQGPHATSADGVRPDWQENVTIKNMKLSGFMDNAIKLYGTDKCLITKNYINACFTGIFIYDYTFDNGVTENTIDNSGNAIYIGGTASSVSILANDLKNSYSGVYIEGSNSYNNSIIGNNMTGNNYGIELRLAATNNHIHHNNFINNAVQFSVSADSYPNFWDNGTQGGNYWSDYGLRYPEASERDSTGTWNTSYAINSNNQDHYPLMNPVIPEFPSTLTLTVFMTSAIAGAAVVLIAKRNGKVQS